jgi:ribokinase
VWAAAEPTGAIAVLIGSDGRRTMATQRGASVGLSPDDLEESWFRDAGLLHVPAYSLFTEPLASAARAAIRVVREAGGMLAVDLSSAAGLRDYGPARMAYVLARLTPEVLFATEAESATLAVPLESLAQVPVLKLGAAGCRVFGRDIAAPSVQSIDPTGAGDAFAAAFCTAWLHGAAPIEAAERAVEAASQSVSLVGARPR